MCNPATIAAAGLSISGIQGILGYKDNRHQVQDEQTANDAFYAANKDAAVTAADVQMADIGLRQSQELLATSTQKTDVTQEAQGVTSSVNAMAAERNVSGSSVDAQLNDIAERKAVELSRLDTNSNLVQDQLQRSKGAVIIDAQNNINSVRQVKYRKPSVITPIIGIAGAGVSAYDYYKQKTDPEWGKH